MFELPSIEAFNIGATLPVFFLAMFATVLLILDLFVPDDRKIITARLTLGALIVAFIINIFTFDLNEAALSNSFIADQFTGFVNMVVLVAAFLGVLLSIDYLEQAGIERGEFYPLMLFSVVGMMLMGSANDIIVIFVALELLSIPLYVMSAMRYNDPKSEESGMKYFILGAFSSAFLVYGGAMLYGATGTTNLSEIFNAVENIVATESSSLLFLLLGAGLTLVGLGFKVAVVPFHMWTPDVYEGAPTPVVAFMSIGSKAGGFAALLRVFVIGLPTLFVDAGDTVAAWQTTVWIVSALTMIVGNFIAISQSNIKRMLAYSSIAHAGYILMAVAAVGTLDARLLAVQGALVYLLAYAFTNIGAFAVAQAVENPDGTGTDINDFTGLARSRPLLAVMMAVFMFSLTGIPLTAGFIGKWLVFGAAIQAGLIILAVVGVLTSVISAFYYVRIIVNMFFGEGEGSAAAGATPLVSYAIYTAFAGTLLLGIFPNLALNLVDDVVVIASMIVR